MSLRAIWFTREGVGGISFRPRCDKNATFSYSFHQEEESMYSNSKLRTAVRLGLGIGAGALAAGYAPGAFAQDESSAGEALEEITVTGSRIKRADIDSASPVTVLDREDIMAQGITDVGNLIQRQRQRRRRCCSDRPAWHGH
jgi:hypothetical protein